MRHALAPALVALLGITAAFGPALAAAPTQDDAGTGRDAPDRQERGVLVPEGTHGGRLLGASGLGASVADGADWYRVHVAAGERILLTFAAGSATGSLLGGPHLQLRAPNGAFVTFLLDEAEVTRDDVIADATGAWRIGIVTGGGDASYSFTVATEPTNASWRAQRGTGHVSARLDLAAPATVRLRATIPFDDLSPVMVAYAQLRDGDLARWDSTSIVPFGPRASATTATGGRVQAWVDLEGSMGAYRETTTLRLNPGSYVVVQVAKAAGAYLAVETEAAGAVLRQAGPSGVIALRQADFAGTLGVSTPTAHAGLGLERTIEVGGLLIARYACDDMVAECRVDRGGETSSVMMSEVFVGAHPTWRFTRDREASAQEDKFVLFGVDLH